MLTGEPQFLQLGPPRSDAAAPPRRIAHSCVGEPGLAPATLLWLPGFLSDMQSTKVTELSGWANLQGLSVMRFDYSGHGASSGDVAEGSIGDWLEEAAAVLELVGDRPVILVGSSLGGWLSLLLARKLLREGAKPLAGLVLIAPAWDMTEALMWQKLSDRSRAEIEQNGIYFAPSDYGQPYPISRFLIEEGRNHLLSGSRIDPGCPVRILQGMRDPDVPWRHALALVDMLSSDDVELDLIKDGDHRLSRPQDLRRLERAVSGLIETLNRAAFV